MSPDLLRDVSAEGAMYYLMSLGLYLYFLYICAQSMIPSKRDRWMYATIMMSLQFVLTTFFGVNGYEGWLLFAFVIAVSEHRPAIEGIGEDLIPLELAFGLMLMPAWRMLHSNLSSSLR